MILIQILHLAITAITWLIIIKVILSYFLSPYHPIRETIDRLVEPMLSPIRNILPQTGMIDFSPLVLIILLQVFEFLLTRVFASFL